MKRLFVLSVLASVLATSSVQANLDGNNGAGASSNQGADQGSTSQTSAGASDNASGGNAGSAPSCDDPSDCIEPCKAMMNKEEVPAPFRIDFACISQECQKTTCEEKACVLPTSPTGIAQRHP